MHRPCKRPEQHTSPTTHTHLLSSYLLVWAPYSVCTIPMEVRRPSPLTVLLPLRSTARVGRLARFSHSPALPTPRTSYLPTHASTASTCPPACSAVRAHSLTFGGQPNRTSICRPHPPARPPPLHPSCCRVFRTAAPCLSTPREAHRTWYAHALLHTRGDSMATERACLRAAALLPGHLPLFQVTRRVATS